MRVFYPISARISDFVNEQTSVKSGLTPVWGLLTIAIITVVLSNLSTFEGGAAEKQHETFTQNHDKTFSNKIAMHDSAQNTKS